MNNITTNMDVMNDAQQKNEKRIWKGRLPNPEYLPMKKCRTCGEIKTIDEFYKNNRMHDGHLHQCKICQSTQMNNHWKTEKGKETLKKALKKYSHSPKGKFLRVKLGHKKRGGGKIEMTVEDFQILLETQTECAICGERFSKENQPYTDHILAIKNEKGKPSPLSTSNIQLLCQFCSGSKWNRTLTQEDVFRIKLAKIYKQMEADNE